eukprot:CAMPEP_0172807202 /NCGR_PEP_ID=MMETSP1075-20121228/6852_1 /TAXON_ID=2916 /ORGANISM="Ceratium fusus, Strain PA161109" /LENGTH=85 /DNA_ID=CAMNT_0013646147 /DNA_START=82 /DNA_END=339 /DNA_ORIENTATION=+
MTMKQTQKLGYRPPSFFAQYITNNRTAGTKIMKTDAAMPPGAARGALSQGLASAAIPVAPGIALKVCDMLRARSAMKPKPGASTV